MAKTTVTFECSDSPVSTDRFNLLEKHIMEALETLKREIAETKTAVSNVGGAVADVAARVQSIVSQLANSPTAETLVVLADELDGEQTKLAAIGTALANIAPATPVEPPPTA